MRLAPVAAQSTPPADLHTSGQSLLEIERAALHAQLQSHRGSRAELARKLGISERSLYRKLRSISQPE